MRRPGVVIVEDEEGIRDTLKLFLEIEGHTVDTAENGEAALELLSRVPRPGVILLDLMMPVMDGWHFVQKMRENRNLATIPIVVVSAFANESHGISVDAIVSKPLDPEKLLGLVNHYCDAA